jgi:hypothetical protein
MNWTADKQRQYMTLVDRSHEAARNFLKHLPEEHQTINALSAFAEAYRAGALDAIFGVKEETCL